MTEQTAERPLSRIDDFRPDGESSTPLYVQLSMALRHLIEDGFLRPGEALPSERRIMEQTGLSRVTIRKAFEMLANMGLLTQKRGSGTFISGAVPRIEQPLTRLTSFTEDMINRGRVPTVSWLEKRLRYPTSEEVMMLGLSPGEKVLHLHRLRAADGVPVALEMACVPARYLPDPDLVGESLYEALSKVGAMPVRATQRLKARSLPAFEAEQLHVPPGDPALHIERMSRLADGTVIEFTRSYYRSDTYDFVAELTIPPIGGQ